MTGDQLPSEQRNLGQANVGQDTAHQEMPAECESELAEPEARAVERSTEANEKRRRSKTAVWGSTSLMIGIFVALNWPVQYVERFSSGSVQSIVDLPNQAYELPVMAGAPFRYWIDYRSGPAGRPETEDKSNVLSASQSVFSWTALLINIACLVTLITVFQFYAHRKKLKQKSKGRGNLTIADLMIATSLVAASFGWYQYLQGREKAVKKYANSMMGKNHGVVFSAWLPEIIADQLPDSFAKKFVRVRAVRLDTPSPEDLDEAMALTTLTCFRIGGNNYQLKQLQPLLNKVHLVDIRIAGRRLDRATMQMIGSMPRLHTLSLMRTDVSSETLASLQLPRLRRLNAMHSDVVLSKLGRPSWSKSITELWLPHPSRGSDQLTIEGWPSLKFLSVNDWDHQLNADAVQLKLSGLPKLETLELGQLQKFSLELSDLPEFTGWQGKNDFWEMRLARGESMPGRVWLSRLVAENVPKLETVEIYGAEIEEIKLSKLPGLDAVYVAAFRNLPMGYPQYVRPEKETRDALVKGLGASDGPALIDLDAVFLRDTDLTPLCENAGLEQLFLASTGVATEEVKKLASTPNLKHLRLGTASAGPADLASILTLFPNLEVLEFQFDTNDDMIVFDRSADSFQLARHAHLTELTGNAMRFDFFNSVRIESMPRLQSSFDFQWVGNEIWIDRSPSLKGLSFSSPLPSKTHFGGFRDLEYFAAGGAQVTDTVVESLSDCDQLTTITLAYADASKAALSELNLRAIVNLSLPGCKVDDSVVRNWGSLPTLQSLDLSHTEVTAASLQTLLASESIQSLRLDGCDLKPADLAGLTGMTMLRVLSLADIGIDQPTLTKIASFGMIKHLNLAGSKVSKDLLSALDGTDIELLVLRDCEVDSRAVYELMRRHPSLMLDPTGSNLDSNVHTRLMAEQRVIDEHDYAEFKATQQWRQKMANSSQGMMMAMELPTVKDEFAKIDVEAFSPVGEFAQMKEDADVENRDSDAPSLMNRMFGRLFGGQAIGGPQVIVVDQDVEVSDKSGIEESEE
ncbi:leucine-rich repeat domain-containing protein [Roseiconus lacunae]|uniref:hypothetical protein n=1 Tax=Roseiconus lacunae TaxID=2605694 RepID=UPI0011F1AD1E|nr:hypothetical protein [Roseiconus lacunae]